MLGDRQAGRLAGGAVKATLKQPDLIPGLPSVERPEQCSLFTDEELPTVITRRRPDPEFLAAPVEYGGSRQPRGAVIWDLQRSGYSRRAIFTFLKSSSKQAAPHNPLDKITRSDRLRP